MFIAKKSMTLKEMRVGAKVWMPNEAAEIVKIAHKDSEDDEPNIKQGTYKIQDTTKLDGGYYRQFNVPDEAIPMLYIEMQRLDSIDQFVGDVALITVNYAGQAIMANGQILIDDIMFRCFSSLKELQRENEDLYFCASCGNALNIVTNTVRICNECEKE